MNDQWRALLAQAQDAIRLLVEAEDQVPYLPGLATHGPGVATGYNRLRHVVKTLTREPPSAWLPALAEPPSLALAVGELATRGALPLRLKQLGHASEDLVELHRRLVLVPCALAGARIDCGWDPAMGGR